MACDRPGEPRADRARSAPRRSEHRCLVGWVRERRRSNLRSPPGGLSADAGPAICALPGDRFKQALTRPLRGHRGRIRPVAHVLSRAWATPASTRNCRRWGSTAHRARAGRRSGDPHPPPQAARPGRARQCRQLLQESDRPGRAGRGTGGAHPGMPLFRGAGDDTRKLSAAWLIDQCGWKGQRGGDAGWPPRTRWCWSAQAATGAQLLGLARRIATSVQALRRGHRKARNRASSATTVSNGPRPTQLRAAGLMLASTVAFGLMAICIRLASRTEPVAEIAIAFRNLFGLLALLPLLLWPAMRAGALGAFACAACCAPPSCAAISSAARRRGQHVDGLLGDRPPAPPRPCRWPIPRRSSSPSPRCCCSAKRCLRRWLAVMAGFIGVLVIVRPWSTAFTAAVAGRGGRGDHRHRRDPDQSSSREDGSDTIVLWTYLFWVPMSLPAALWFGIRRRAWPGCGWCCRACSAPSASCQWTWALKLSEVSALDPDQLRATGDHHLAGWLWFDEAIDRWTMAGRCRYHLAATAISPTARRCWPGSTAAMPSEVVSRGPEPCRSARADRRRLRAIPAPVLTWMPPAPPPPCSPPCCRCPARPSPIFRRRRPCPVATSARPRPRRASTSSLGRCMPGLGPVGRRATGTGCVRCNFIPGARMMPIGERADSIGASACWR